MKLSHRLIAALVCVASALVPAAPAFSWGETERWSGAEIAKLSGAPPSASVPSLPAELQSKRAQLAGSQLPVRMDVDADGNMYVLSQGPAVEVIGLATIDGQAAAVPPGCPYENFPGFRYAASLLTLYRVDASTGQVRALRTFLAQTETGIPLPAAFKELSDPPAGLAVDRTATTPKLYVAIPGQGVLRMTLSGEDWSVFVADDHEAWIPFENAGAVLDDGEGEISLVRCLRGDAGVSFYYGELWEGGPTVPGAMAVDPVSHHVLVAEQHGVNGTDSDRSYYGKLRVRRFTEGGTPAGEVDLDATGFARPASGEYPAPDGSATNQRSPAAAGRPGWLLGTPMLESDFADTRVGGMAFTTAAGTSSLVILNQLETLGPGGQVNEIATGQIVRATPSAGGLKAEQVIAADGASLPFGPVPTTRGIEDLAVRQDGTGGWRYLVPTTSAGQAGLVEMKADGTPLGFVGAAAGGSCAWVNSRVRLATDPRNGTILLLQQPAAPGGATVIIRLDPRATGCTETTPPEEVEPTPPELTVVGAEYTDPIGSTLPFSPVADGDTIELDADSPTDGWVFSVRVTDDDNPAGGDFGAAATCTRVLAVQGRAPETRTAGLARGECRPLQDTAAVMGVPGGAEDGVFRITKAQLRDAATGSPLNAQLTVTVRDDDDPQETASVTIQFRLKVSQRAPADITAFAYSPTTRRFTMAAGDFDEWRLEFGDGSTQPESGWGTASNFPATSRVADYPVGTFTATLTVRRNGGVLPEDIAVRTATVTVDPVATERPTTTPTPQSGAACETPLGIPLSQLGLGDELLCVPADPCDVNTAELGLTRLPILRPASCAGDDGGFVAAGTDAATPPTGSRPTFLARALKLGADRRIGARIRCGTGPTACAGRVRLQLVTSGGAVSLGQASFGDLPSGRTTTVKIQVSKTVARRLRRAGSGRVKVTVSPSVPAGFTRPRADTRTVNLTIASTRRAR